jgi:hypothetical protein
MLLGRHLLFSRRCFSSAAIAAADTTREIRAAVAAAIAAGDDELRFKPSDGKVPFGAEGAVAVAKELSNCNTISSLR